MRKKDHINIALKDKTTKTSLDNYRIDYNSIPYFGISEVDTSTTICNQKWQYPFFINAITSGGEECNFINKQLEEVCEICNIEFFAGSYSPALKNEEDKKCYPKNKSINIGLDKNYSTVLKAIEEVNPKYIQLHTNPLQEMIMPEGDKNFENWLNNLKVISTKTQVPIILKETGFGMNNKTIELAIKLNLAAVDISGKDGTNFAKIENSRTKNPSPYLEEIGYTTAESLEIAKNYKNKIDIIASGGIRNPLDVIKCLALGAKAVGISRVFLDILINKGKEELIAEIKKWQEELKYIMILTNSKNIKELENKIRKI
ncbi:type 2 isopentenyl-diphosphate Delta-isomerase [Gemella sp. GH3]|uniref:type 2 isopentenyl-diphosphate Delta-isomerase n=1 Tax=unclassified Gemella TaxID=2624949 RepID=UPI0015CFE781|nr:MULTISPECIES: type 2 isopentenyl-diphosphate Delta-isomerase [unclassified Gemella]MBF0714228.1 type 2 isopentenyl-diphosphate Delta-isomerase [Gemella sp. GH3.1]NYS51180.1 type 2 isopentenyl-diphosphate Delta-isomerase [Gemella sp. GH3]